jgi:short-subunit dehydrogenase
MSQQIAVTGGTKGIGRAIVELFLKNDHEVFTCARNQDDLQKMSEVLNNQYPGKLHVLSCDLSARKGQDAFIQFVNEKTGDLDVIINNTGVFIPGKITEEEEGMLELMINTNLYSAYHVSRGLLPQLVRKKSGQLINICSTASITAYPNGGSYCISKFAMYGMTKVLREEMKEHNVKVTAIHPGPTYTASWEGADIPEERFGSAEDVAEMVYSTFELSKRSVIEDIVIRPQLGDL